MPAEEVGTSAQTADLKLLADNLAAVEKYNSQGGSIVLCGLTPEGLDSYTKIVGVDHSASASSSRRCATGSCPASPRVT